MGTDCCYHPSTPYLCLNFYIKPQGALVPWIAMYSKYHLYPSQVVTPLENPPKNPYTLYPAGDVKYVVIHAQKPLNIVGKDAPPYSSV